MPRILSDAGYSRKRKRISAEQRPSKRSRSDSEGEEDVLAPILGLGPKISSSKRYHKHIPSLIEIIQGGSGDGKDDHSLVAAISLCGTFTRFMITGEMSKKSGNTKDEAEVIENLRTQYSKYKVALVGLLAQDGVLGSTALDLCMRLLKTESESLLKSQKNNFPVPFLTRIVRALLEPGNDGSTRKEFSETYVEEYDDIRFYTLEAIAESLKSRAPNNSVFDNTIDILKSIESVPEEEEELEDFYVPAPKQTSHDLYSLNKHKKRAQAAWLALMNQEMSKNQRKVILGIMSESIAPWFMKPELLMDFLTDSYNSGGSTSLLAISGLFYLMQERNLDYPSFYHKLYSLLDREILHSLHRSRFLRLLDTFLSSTHLPAVLVASFIKRLARLTLNASPSGIVPIIPWIYNILKKHPTCTFMIHRVPRTPEQREMLESDGMTDPFLMEEEDPMRTNAIDSCLWEIVTLQSHYHPNLATLTKIISEQFTKNAYNLEDFLDHSYDSMLVGHLTKDIKKEPYVEFEIPRKIFTKQSDESGVEDSDLVKIWDF